jgi:[ribosomal protein S5]-alanine N-acetyltransferase
MNVEQKHEILMEGEQIYLRRVCVNDVNQRYIDWMNDPQVTKYLESRFYTNTEESIVEYIKDKQNDKHNLFMAIITRDGHRHIGNSKIGPIDWNHRLAEVGIMLGDKDYWYKGIATEVLKLMSDYAFKKLKLHKLTAGCYEENKGSSKAFQKAGFTLEGIRKNHLICENKYQGLVFFGLINHEE